MWSKDRLKNHKGMLGKKHSEATKIKIGRANAIALLGNKPSLETILKKRATALRLGLRPPIITGNRHWKWKGGKTLLSNRIRKITEYVLWRKAVFFRDKYTCVFCKKIGGNLEADHHPLLFSEILKKYNIKSIKEARSCKVLWDINNGRTVCVLCHTRSLQGWIAKGSKVKK